MSVTPSSQQCRARPSRKPRKSELGIFAFSRACHTPAPLKEPIFRKIVASIQENWLVRVAVVAADANRLNLHL